MCTRTFAMLTFGCKVNQYESQALRERLIDLGFVPVPRPEEAADAYIVNTCTVTDTARREGVRQVRRLVRQRPGALVVVTGCAAESNPGDFADLEGVVVFGNRRKDAVGDFLARRFDVEGEVPGPLRITRIEGHTRAFVKVQDGCDLRCSFCIIPEVRGPNQSRPADEAVGEVRRLVEHGVREVVLTGVHLGSYGKDGRAPRLAGLVRMILDEVPGLARLRLSSIEVNEVDEPLVDLLANEPRLCPHLHLPLQSGDDGVLRAMRRRYNTRMFRETVQRVRDRVEAPVFTTDVIVGFPTETDEAFERSAAFCREIGFARMHLFPYSRRAGTAASRLPEVSRRTKRARMERMQAVARESAARVYAEQVGREVSVLLERENRGYTERYLHAQVQTGPLPPNTLIRARVRAAEEELLLCEVE